MAPPRKTLQEARKRKLDIDDLYPQPNSSLKDPEKRASVESSTTGSTTPKKELEIQPEVPDVPYEERPLKRRLRPRKAQGDVTKSTAELKAPTKSRTPTKLRTPTPTKSTPNKKAVPKKTSKKATPPKKATATPTKSVQTTEQHAEKEGNGDGLVQESATLGEIPDSQEDLSCIL